MPIKKERWEYNNSIIIASLGKGFLLSPFHFYHLLLPEMSLEKLTVSGVGLIHAISCFCPSRF